MASLVVNAYHPILLIALILSSILLHQVEFCISSVHLFSLYIHSHVIFSSTCCKQNDNFLSVTALYNEVAGVNQSIIHIICLYFFPYFIYMYISCPTGRAKACPAWNFQRICTFQPVTNSRVQRGQIYWHTCSLMCLHFCCFFSVTLVCYMSFVSVVTSVFSLFS